ncbi:hypothetical protein ACP70R_032668 [Stipagrostis hirtigluma subsp. patula]
MTVTTSWPKLLNKPAAQAQQQIRRDRRDVRIEIHFEDESLSDDQDDLRVRLIVKRDASLTVAKIPKAG